MSEGYAYDAFLSFSRSGNVKEWVANHFLPLLSNALNEQLDHEPQLFVDFSLETGAAWPGQLAHALKRSRCLVPVWSTSYFRSRWCLSELSSMIAREKQFGLYGVRTLIVPVVFSGGYERFPAEAKHRQWLDVRQWAVPFEQFRRTERYLELHDAIERLAQLVAVHVKDAPAWSPDFPIIETRDVPPEEEPLTFPRLR